MRTNSLVDNRCFYLPAAINSSRSSQQTPAVCCMLDCRLLPTVWKYSHSTACCFLFVLLAVLLTIFKFTSWVMCLVAGLAASRWTTWCLHSCCVLISDRFDEAPANGPDFDLLGPGCGGCVSMICWCGIGEEDDNDKMWEALSIT